MAGSVDELVEIQHLTARYNRAADGTDPAALLELFVDDAVFEMHGGEPAPTVYRGNEIGGLVARAEGQRVHMTMNAIVTVDGDQATQECTLLLCTRSHAQPIGAFFTGRYADELVKTSGGWRFKRRVAHVDFVHEARFALVNGAA
jgi:hypothetical protein